MKTAPHFILPLILAALSFAQAPKKKIAPKPAPALKQTAAFDFHGDELGETWTDFQARHTDRGTTCWGSAAVEKAHGLEDPFPPRDPILPPIPPQKETGILYCTVGHLPTEAEIRSNIEPQKQTLVGMSVEVSPFQFFEDKLFYISIIRLGGTFEGQLAYELIKSAYATKYGAPDQVLVTKYQNGFGATFEAESSAWADPVRSYSLLVSDSAHHDSVGVSFTDLNAQKKQQRAVKLGDL